MTGDGVNDSDVNRFIRISLSASPGAKLDLLYCTLASGRVFRICHFQELLTRGAEFVHSLFLNRGFTFMLKPLCMLPVLRLCTD
jgi:hypothetical protein